jgi:hypothetical protein
MTAKTKAEMMARLRAEKRAAGLREITVWVPVRSADYVRGYAESLCANERRIQERRKDDAK